MLNPQQLTILKAAIQAEQNPDFAAIRSAGALGAMAEWYNQPHTTFYVWKTRLSEHDINSLTSVDGTVWSWTAFIARSPSEQNAWARMFNGTYTVNPSLKQVRDGIADIFSGGTAPAV